ncbi:hypothetical protein JHK82_052372 [Glycine max]|uniref:Uncharacterized protein n=2 Tax=Glycine subgen. Soja TaxID=1462606 RepID=A0A0R0EHM3_SOYBN|nr:hypothetical protein JHK86_052205 [Glycine max]KAG4914730.1 hypothetical protein JHK87_052287 [Glycine soja]KAG4926576.1 hypothetical protein JHK85_053062 [Glycine max]KAG5082209.1 hypothetical protein JHK84_052247 [Glycine max]KAG5084975.1 hypothetical protein JHK82_052372 [Glycine max]
MKSRSKSLVTQQQCGENKCLHRSFTRQRRRNRWFLSRSCETNDLNYSMHQRRFCNSKRLKNNTHQHHFSVPATS